MTDSNKNKFFCRLCKKKFALRFRYMLSPGIEFCVSCAHGHEATRGCGNSPKLALEIEQRERSEKMDRNIPL